MSEIRADNQPLDVVLQEYRTAQAGIPLDKFKEWGEICNNAGVALPPEDRLSIGVMRAEHALTLHYDSKETRSVPVYQREVEGLLGDAMHDLAEVSKAPDAHPYTRAKAFAMAASLETHRYTQGVGKPSLRKTLAYQDRQEAAALQQTWLLLQQEQLTPNEKVFAQAIGMIALVNNLTQDRFANNYIAQFVPPRHYERLDDPTEGVHLTVHNVRKKEEVVIRLGLRSLPRGITFDLSGTESDVYDNSDGLALTRAILDSVTGAPEREGRGPLLLGSMRYVEDSLQTYFTHGTMSAQDRARVQDLIQRRATGSIGSAATSAGFSAALQGSRQHSALSTATPQGRPRRSVSPVARAQQRPHTQSPSAPPSNKTEVPAPIKLEPQVNFEGMTPDDLLAQYGNLETRRPFTTSEAEQLQRIIRHLDKTERREALSAFEILELSILHADAGLSLAGHDDVSAKAHFINTELFLAEVMDNFWEWDLPAPLYESMTTVDARLPIVRARAGDSLDRELYGKKTGQLLGYTLTDYENIKNQGGSRAGVLARLARSTMAAHVLTMYTNDQFMAVPALPRHCGSHPVAGPDVLAWSPKAGNEIKGLRFGSVPKGSALAPGVLAVPPKFAKSGGKSLFVLASEVAKKYSEERMSTGAEKVLASNLQRMAGELAKLVRKAQPLVPKTE